MKQIRTTLGNNPASPDNFYEEEGVYESFASAENEIDEIDEEMSLSIQEYALDDSEIQNIIESKEEIVPQNEDPYANILKDVQ